jgi:uncharacterized protein (DUF433 family)
MSKKNIGSSFDEFLTGGAIIDEASAVAVHRVAAWQAAQEIEAQGGKLRGRITVDPSLCHGKPCIRGLRYPVEDVLEWLASGMTTEEILAEYEDLEREDILAVLTYAARMVRVKRMVRFEA